MNRTYIEYGFSKNFMKNILKVLKKSFSYATDVMGYIKINTTLNVKLPKYDVVAGGPAHIFTQEEIERILDRFKNTTNIYYAFLTTYYTGMRTSEVFGLTWDCADFDNKTITINKNIIRKNKFGLPK